MNRTMPPPRWLLPPRPPATPAPPDIDDLTRRDLLRGIGALGAGWVLTACARPQAERASGGGTRTFVDSAGRAVEVPAVATRIVATHDSPGAQLLSIGAPVIGMATRGGDFDPSLRRFFDLDGLAPVGEVYEPDLEALAGLEPDLIVHEAFDGAVTLDDEIIARLSQLAPVVGIDPFRSVEEIMADYARLLGSDAEERIAALEAEFEAALERLRVLLGDRWSEVTASLVIQSAPGELRTLGPTANPLTDVLTRLGVDWVDFVREAGEPDNGGYLGGISLEELPAFDADVLIVTGEVDQVVVDNPLYPSLKAVQAGQVVLVREGFGLGHWHAYIAAAELLHAELSGRELRTDLV